MNNKRNLKFIFYASSGIIVLAFLFAFSLFMGCPIRKFFKFPCPACGITRAYVALFSGDITAAFHYHPLFFLLPIVFILVILLLTDEKKKSGKFTRLYTVISAVILFLFLILYFIRLFTNTIP